ncbi:MULTISPECIES: hypothetical protein [Vibrio]|uniref:Heat-shock protein HtpX n=1 Tax=Vibrio mimicus TaxID=674 RepID=A0A1D8SC61_VIBMI|nr:MULTISPECIES: hypothetical protein [Vibrio]ERM58697.1 heat shock protein HtpX [Vibrio mimicus CAIM 1882]ERM59710.1 heat shock protein HtpX [Vibrio mimicus CAIM 1883]AMG04188.1 hypothetical protein AL543_14885 [Vibrio mimicus]AOW82895.1 hypothetical protein VM_09280 [Vibrio mimicus]EEY38911.1 hypothetical protein VII_002672 [Vibrio mimicus MB451]
MAEAHSYQMAIDLLCCHLGISEQEARAQLGLEAKEQTLQQKIVETQQSLMGMRAEK